MQAFRPEVTHRLGPDWSKRLIRGGVIPTPVLSHFEVVSDARLCAFGRFRPVENSESNLFWDPEPSYVVSSWTTTTLGPRPGPGEHKRQILRDVRLTYNEIYEFGIAGTFDIEVVPG